MRRIRSLSFIDAPPQDKIMAALSQLEQYRLIKPIGIQKKKGFMCTDQGNKLATFPVDPILGRILFTASKNNCLVEAITILAFLSSDSVFTNDAANDDSKNEEARRKFSCNEGDHVRMLSIYQFFKSIKKNSSRSVTVRKRLMGVLLYKNHFRMNFIVLV